MAGLNDRTYTPNEIKEIWKRTQLQQSDDDEVLISAKNLRDAAMICEALGYYVEDGENGGKLAGIVPL